MISEEFCRRYLTHCRDERRLSTNTLSAYDQDLKEFSARFSGRDLISLSAEELVGYVSYLRDEPELAPATVKRRIACLKGLFGWLGRRGLLSTNPFGLIDVRVRISDRLWNMEDLVAMVEAADAKPDRRQAPRRPVRGRHDVRRRRHGAAGLFEVL